MGQCIEKLCIEKCIENFFAEINLGLNIMETSHPGEMLTM